MFVVRPAETSDIPALEALAGIAMHGVHTLPRTRKAIERAVVRSIASFASCPEMPGDESYFFVLESHAGKPLAGAAAISATAGAHGAFFAFRNDVLQQVSRDLDISHNVHTLTLCSDLSGYSQLSGFFLCERNRAWPQASLLSRARLLFAAVAPHRFGDKFFAAMPGITDAGLRSPFWEALGRKFFQMDFLEAERMIEGARNRTLIVELMPHYPVYVPLLPAEAQAAMGRVHAEGELPFRILSGEGFVPDEYIDIFDGGPVLRARRNALRSFSASMRCQVADAGGAGEAPPSAYLVAAMREEKFRATVIECSSPEWSGQVSLPADARRALDVADGDAVLCVEL
ncbi:arginine N-succinyltransferase [Noviherbaspirillum autotrophicum]|uniref:Arginine N-succinyltransferase n=1 Tax=Noviherbaspirillum autotrophicum TaxID=709839 RepID=A0A0C1Y1R9_9BURK|nr:arginine N-succinyltransferase [Noviherbaspirillum autotrophicum]KIF80978.1 arginine N-succinyltransferase [Noviherbaspirillum autotrophicum]